MALNLVAYESSDESETEQPTPVASAISQTSKSTVQLKVAQEDNEHIPKPSQKELELAEVAKREKANLSKNGKLGSLSQKRNGKVIIGIPSLADLDEDDEKKKEAKPDKVLSHGQSKLFSKLPAPRHTSQPPPVNVMKPQESTVKKSVPLIPQSVTRKQVVKNDSDDEEMSSGFFTMDEPIINEPAVPVNIEPISYLPNTGVIQPEIYSAVSALPTNQQYNMAGLPDDVANTYASGDSGLELDDVALQALQGSSGVKRKLPDEAQIIDIQGERLTYDPNMSYLKSISEEQSVSRGPDITYNKVQKKKHQITYLAAQAKAREVDLKNQWAQNKSTRRQTQAKYGF